MRKKPLISILFPVGALVVLLAQLFLPAGCANIVPPLGGPRDSLPPLLVRVRPVDSSTNFNARKIVFEFSEFVQVENAIQNLLVSPTPKTNPQVDAKLRTVTVEIRDTLEPNTTYTYNFGNAIKDVNEGNPLRNFSYTFSTGATIDSLRFSGNVIVAETGKPDSTLIAALYRNGRDSAVFKEDARYIARVDRDGNFTFRNLPAGTFYLYVFTENPGAKRYGGRGHLFAYSDSPLVIRQSTPRRFLYAYVEEEAPQQAKSSGSTLARPTGLKGTGTAADKRLRVETNLDNNEQDLLKPFEVYFRAAPLKEFDSSKIVFTDENFNKITNYRIFRDSSNTKITLQYRWPENTAYHLIVDKDFAMDTMGRKIPETDTLSFRTKKSSSYGAVKLRFINLDLSRNPILQFVQGEKVVDSVVMTSRDYSARLVVPGEYDLRILYDENKNGKWDKGSFFGNRRQPEKVIPITRKLNVKANWDNEVDFTL